jgi:DNA-binding winged helix-turn-helix (wHTH) protein
VQLLHGLDRITKVLRCQRLTARSVINRKAVNVMQTNQLMCAPTTDGEDVLGRILQMRTAEAENFQFGPFTLIPGRRLLLAGQDHVELGGRAFDILVLLVKRAGEVVSLRQILEHVWQDVAVDDSNIRVQVGDLRRALGPKYQRFIVTVHARGYVFVAPVQRLPS